MIHFHNQTDLPLKAFTTFGASVKPPGSFGVFGTGLKHALAWLARENAHVDICLDDVVYSLGRKSDTFKGEAIEHVVLLRNDEVYVLPFTTNLARGWRAWMAYRELRCNALDEGGGISSSTIYARTVISVQHPEFDQLFSSNEYFLEHTEPMFTSLGVEVIDKPSTNIFYRGVAVMALPQPAGRTYNILSDIRLTEDRTAASSFEIQQLLVQAIMSHDDIKDLTAWVAEVGPFEEKLDFRSSWLSPSRAWMELVRKTKKLPASLLSWYSSSPGYVSDTRPEGFSPPQQLAIDTIIKDLASHFEEWQFIPESPFAREAISVQSGAIYLSPAFFDIPYSEQRTLALAARYAANAKVSLVSLDNTKLITAALRRAVE